MAVARKLNHQPSSEALILTGTPIESCRGVLVRAHGSVAGDVTVPAAGVVTLGEDGLLIESSALDPRIRHDLVSWDSTTPLVAGSLYFIPWPQLVSTSAFAHDHSGGSAVMFDHCDGDVTHIRFDDWASAEAFAASAASRCCGVPAFFEDPQLRLEIVEYLQEHPLSDSDEIYEALCESGWENLEESHIEMILNDFQLPTYFHAHVWFVEEDTDLDELDEESLRDSIVAAVADDPDDAQGIFERMTDEGWNIESIDDVYDVLYDPSVPVFKRTRAWYFDDDIEGEN